MEKLGIPMGKNMLRSLRDEDLRRVQGAARRMSVLYRLQRKNLRFSKKKTKASKSIAYKAGSFGVGSKPESQVNARKKGREGAKINNIGEKRKRSCLSINGSGRVVVQFVPEEEIPLVKLAKLPKRQLLFAK